MWCLIQGVSVLGVQEAAAGQAPGQGGAAPYVYVGWFCVCTLWGFEAVQPSTHSYDSNNLSPKKCSPRAWAFWELRKLLPDRRLARGVLRLMLSTSL